VGTVSAEQKKSVATNPHISSDSTHIPCLDGWRAVAISSVILGHGLWHVSRPAQRLAAVGVNLFFAISGYLICTLLVREFEQTGTISLKGFYIRRAFRILPPAILYLAVIAIMGELAWILLEEHELSTALLAANYFPDRSWYTAHFWSLSLEEHFYLFWPALLIWLKPKRACLVGLVLVAACLIYRPWAAQHIYDAFRYQRTDMRIDAFVLPCCLAVILRQEVWRRRLARWLNEGVMVLILLAMAGIALAAEQNPAMTSLNKFFLAAALPLLVVSPILRPSSWLAAILSWRPLAWLGKISYGVYLWQELFLEDTSSTPERLAWLPVAIGLIILCAWLSYRFLERPLRDFGRRLAADRPAPEPERVAIGEN
jgi:peptidoglycan/LPS O-acetylase OafA/YrhL